MNQQTAICSTGTTFLDFVLLKDTSCFVPVARISASDQSAPKYIPQAIVYLLWLLSDVPLSGSLLWYVLTFRLTVQMYQRFGRPGRVESVPSTFVDLVSTLVPTSILEGRVQNEKQNRGGTGYAPGYNADADPSSPRPVRGRPPGGHGPWRGRQGGHILVKRPLGGGGGTGPVWPLSQRWRIQDSVDRGRMGVFTPSSTFARGGIDMRLVRRSE